MKFKKIVKTGLIVLGLYAGLRGYSYIIGKDDILKRDGYFFARNDGLINFTLYTHFEKEDYNSDHVTKIKVPFPGVVMDVTYSDKNGDGRIDKIDKLLIFLIFGKNKNLERDVHYDIHQKDFERGDRILAQTKDRFKDNQYVKQFEKNNKNI